MASRRALYTARWLIPVSSAPVEHGAVLVNEMGRIEATGPATALRSADVAEVALGEAALLPGLVNVHAHAELAAFRGLLEDLRFEDWIDTLMRLKAAAHPTPDDWAAAARWTCVEAVAAGVTTLAATEDSGAAFDALRDSGLRGIVYREVFGPDPRQADHAFRQLRLQVDAARRSADSRVRIGVSPHAPYTVSDALYRLVADYAAAESLPVATHAAEAGAEEALVVRGTGRFARGLNARGIATPPRAASTIELLDRTGVLGVRPLLIHCVRLRGSDVRRIAAAGATVAHCPTANARLGHGTAAIRSLLDAGVTVGLGTDSVASNNRIDMLEEARQAQLMHRARHRASTMLPVDHLLALATIEGARALGIADDTGSLEPGKAADLCAVRLDAPHVWPVNDPIAAVVLAARATDVSLTVVDGRILYRDGVVHTLPVPELRTRLAAFAGRLRAARATLAR